MFANSTPLPYIIDTDIGGDIDDAIALLLALNSHSKPLAITTTHIDPEEKARIAKLILTECQHSDIPVYAGMGTNRTKSACEFKQANSLFPPAYGSPNPGPGEKKWHEKQSVAYRENYPTSFEEMKIENETAPEFIIRLSKQFSPTNKLTIVALGPLHNIAAALKLDSTIANSIKLVSMGGVYPRGYNWLISPEISSSVLSKVETVCITSDFIAKNNLSLSSDELKDIESMTTSRFGKTFIADWKNWHKAEVFWKNATFLYDPVTLYLALHPNEIISSTKRQVTFTCLNENAELKPELSGAWYNKPNLEGQITQLKDNKESMVTFVDKVASPEKIKKEIYSSIKMKLTSAAECKKELSSHHKKSRDLRHQLLSYGVFAAIGAVSAYVAGNVIAGGCHTSRHS